MLIGSDYPRNIDRQRTESQAANYKTEYLKKGHSASASPIARSLRWNHTVSKGERVFLDTSDMRTSGALYNVSNLHKVLFWMAIPVMSRIFDEYTIKISSNWLPP